MHHTFIVNLPDQGAFRCATGSASDKQLSLQSSKRLIISFSPPTLCFITLPLGLEHNYIKQPNHHSAPRHRRRKQSRSVSVLIVS